MPSLLHAYMSGYDLTHIQVEPTNVARWTLTLPMNSYIRLLRRIDTDFGLDPELVLEIATANGFRADLYFNEQKETVYIAVHNGAHPLQFALSWLEITDEEDVALSYILFDEYADVIGNNAQLAARQIASLAHAYPRAYSKFKSELILVANDMKEHGDDPNQLYQLWNLLYRLP